MSEPIYQDPLPRRVFFNTLSNYASRTLILGLSFLLTPVILRQLGDAQYGLALLVGSVVTSAGLLEFGIGSTVTKYVAEYQALQAWDQAEVLIGNATWVYSIVGMILIAVSVLIAPYFATWFNLPSEQRAIAMWLVVASGIGVGLSLPCTTARAVLQGLQRFDLVNVISVSNSIVSTGLTVIVLMLGGGVVGMVVVNVVVTLLAQGMAFWMARRAAPQLRFRWQWADQKVIWRILYFSSGLFINNMAGQIKTRTDEVVIGVYLPVNNVATYAIARRLGEIPLLLTDQFVKVLMPLASHLDAARDRSQLRELYLSSTRLTLAIAVPFSFLVILFARSFLTLWLGAIYASAAPLVFILTLASLIDVSQWPIGSLAQGMAQHRPLALVSLFMAFANLSLSLWLIRFYGVVGVALGTLIPIVVEALVFVIPYGLYISEVDLRTMLKESVWPVILPVASMMIVGYGLREITRTDSWLGLSFISVIVLVVYGVVYLVTNTHQPEYALAHQVFSFVRKTIRDRMKSASG